MKQCSVCLIEKALEFFDAQSTGKLGRRADCKECRKRFIRTQPGLVKLIYSGQRSRSKKKGWPDPAYTEAQLLASLQKLPMFHTLYDNWVASGYVKELSPSIDRIDDNQPYRKGNIQLMTWAENDAKANKACKAGQFVEMVKAVDMLSLDGIYIRSFISVSEAARHFNGVPTNIIGAINNRVTIRRNLDGSTRSSVITKAYGHKWRYSPT